MTFSPEKFNNWEKLVKQKITIAMNEKTNATNFLDQKPDSSNSQLRVVMNREINTEKVYIEYSTNNVLNEEENKYLVTVLKWYPTYLVIEETINKQEENVVTEELSYEATVYTKFSGIKTTHNDEHTNKLILLYENREEGLSILMNKKDAKKLIELICNL